MSLRLFWFAAALFAAVVASAAAGDLSEAEKQGRALAAELGADSPLESLPPTGVLKMRDREKRSTEIPFRLRLIVTSTNRTVVLEPADPKDVSKFTELTNSLSNAQATTPIAGSDLWVGDLGLEFVRWPDQRILKSEMRRGRSCKLLQSTNPKPDAGGYRRVLCWIDNDEGGIVQAEAYDEHNKLLKEFEPKDFKKSNGRWELKEVRIRNSQTGTQTLLQFDLDPK
jgi:hypothetical protein